MGIERVDGSAFNDHMLVPPPHLAVAITAASEVRGQYALQSRQERSMSFSSGAYFGATRP